MTIPEIIDLLKSTWSEPAYAMHRGKKTVFRFACSFTEGLQGLPEDYPYNVPAEIKAFWEIASTARLFKDVDYGQWGLQLLSPADSLFYTELEKQARPATYKAGELVIGRFLGDSDLLIVSCDNDEYGNIRIGLPVDPYPEWPVVAKNFKGFLEKYVEVQGDKFWER